MSLRPPVCPRCHRELPLAQVEPGTFQKCPGCSAELQVEIFPSLLRETPANQAAHLIIDGEASCFYHPTKRASVPCDVCGRFLCALCDIDFNGVHYCLPCLERGGRQGEIQRIEKQRTRYDNIAISLVTIPLLFSCAFIVTAPAALVVIARNWNAPPSLVEHTRVRMMAAGGLAVLELLVGILLTIFVIKG